MAMTGPAYCEVADVILIMTSFNSAGTPGDIATNIVQLAIYQASADVSSWTSQDWGTNSAGQSIAVPDMVQSITLNIAAYYATLSYRKNKPLDSSDPVVLRYNMAMANLKAIQEGMIDPSPEPLNAPISAPGHVVNTNRPTFTLYDSGTTIRNGHIEAEEFPRGRDRNGGRC